MDIHVPEYRNGYTKVSEWIPGYRVYMVQYVIGNKNKTMHELFLTGMAHVSSD